MPIENGEPWLKNPDEETPYSPSKTQLRRKARTYPVFGVPERWNHRGRRRRASGKKARLHVHCTWFFKKSKREESTLG